jgi:hypothetical protein
MATLQETRRSGTRLTRGYDPDDQVDLAGFAGSLAAYAAAVAAVAAAGRLAGRRLPDSYPVRDLVIGGIAAHKFSRLLARSSVASPVRAPFTEFEGAAGSGEHQETARGSHGARHTIGALLTCPFCLGVWVSTLYVAALAMAPRWARCWAALFTVSAVSDTLQHLYARLRDG